MVEETDNLYITRMMELAETDIWHAENVDEIEHAKLAEQMLLVLKTTLKRQKGFADKELQYGDHNRDVLSHYSKKASPYTLAHLLEIDGMDDYAPTKSIDEGQIEMKAFSKPSTPQSMSTLAISSASVQETDLTGDIESKGTDGGEAIKKWRKKGEKLKKLTNPMERVALSKLALAGLAANAKEEVAVRKNSIDDDAELTQAQQEAGGAEFQVQRLEKVRAKIDASLEAVRQVHNAMGNRVVKLQALAKAEAAVAKARAGLADTGGNANLPHKGVSSMMHSALERGRDSMRDLRNTLIDDITGVDEQPSDMPVVPSMPKEIQLELQHHAIIASSLDGNLYGRDMGKFKERVIKIKRSLYMEHCMPSDHVAAAKYMATKAEEEYGSNGRIKQNLCDSETWTRHQLMQVRNMLTFIAVLWLAFCTFFVFMWAVLAQDNKLILTIATDLVVRFSFGETVTNPLVALVFVAAIPALACYIIVHDIKQRFTRDFMRDFAEKYGGGGDDDSSGHIDITTFMKTFPKLTEGDEGVDEDQEELAPVPILQVTLLENGPDEFFGDDELQGQVFRLSALDQPPAEFEAPGVTTVLLDDAQVEPADGEFAAEAVALDEPPAPPPHVALDEPPAPPAAAAADAADGLGTIPPDYICPITQELMRDPVIALDGHSYERDAILQWFGRGTTKSPLTGVVLGSRHISRNHTLRKAIENFLTKEMPHLKDQQNRLDNLEAAIKLREADLASQALKDTPGGDVEVSGIAVLLDDFEGVVAAEEVEEAGTASGAIVNVNVNVDGAQEAAL